MQLTIYPTIHVILSARSAFQPFTLNAFCRGLLKGKDAVPCVKFLYCPMSCKGIDLFHAGLVAAVNCEAQAHPQSLSIVHVHYEMHTFVHTKRGKSRTTHRYIRITCKLGSQIHDHYQLDFNDCTWTQLAWSSTNMNKLSQLFPLHEPKFHCL